MSCIALAAVVAAGATGTIADQPGGTTFEIKKQQTMKQHPYVGLWVTADRNVRHELLPDNRYVEARGTRERAYQGRYTVTGDHIDYVDDTGFTADGDFVDGVLYHGGMVLRRER